ncbi:MAG: formate dehydrogenase accessory sulfurtransferase FdhD [Armatimonadota bacterium]|nr:formate dehydrogenase accessory sulfurtransferase FdhD [Armatimonadota bacterium]MDR5696282.1 formate dehydrogenase accessory sulfurtransferase FdhD [Armatimonadota bacterium]
MRHRPGSKTRTRLWVVAGQRAGSRADWVATEEPMEIRLVAGGQQRTVAVTMRTPGGDFELAAGFLFGEGIVRSREDVLRISYCLGPPAEQHYNVVNVELRSDRLPDLAPLERHFYTTSACGVCGRASLEAIRSRGGAPLPDGPRVPVQVVAALPGTLRSAQGLFGLTGGLHAAALFDPSGKLVAVYEDVGRHNAMDKLVGWAFLENRLPLRDHLVMVSGRASFELVHKAVAAGIPVFCAVSAPSSLAVATAREFGLTLVGFLRGERFNVYAGSHRIQLSMRVGG